MTFSLIRMTISGIVAFFFYALWAYYANSLVTDNTQVLYKAALVQGTYSGIITLVFTFLLELSYKMLSNKQYCLPFMIPSITRPAFFSKESETTKTVETSLRTIERSCDGTCLPGMLLTPMPAIAVQSIFVISVNVAFMTPNLWLTVAPSVFFSAVYGYAYSMSLTRKLKLAQA